MIDEVFCSHELCNILYHHLNCTARSQAYYNIWDNSDQVDYSTGEAPHLYIPAWTQQVVRQWLREIHHIDIDIHTDCGMLGIICYTPYIHFYRPRPKPELLDENDEWENRWIQMTIHLKYEDDKGVVPAIRSFNKYEEAVEAALKKVLYKLKENGQSSN